MIVTETQIMLITMTVAMNGVINTDNKSINCYSTTADLQECLTVNYTVTVVYQIQMVTHHKLQVHHSLWIEQLLPLVPLLQVHSVFKN